MKVKGLFLDYDGTIAPVGISRQESAVSQKTAEILSQIKQLIPVGIITTKDLAFILPRTPFADIWCGIAGLEMKIRNELIEDDRVESMVSEIASALEKAEKLAGDKLFFEKKCDSKGRVLAFCVDWRNSTDSLKARQIAVEIAAYCKSMNLWVIEYKGQPFIDVYPYATDKGKALKEAKAKLGIESGIIYMGDSKVDNPAFLTADIGIGVIHEESTAGLDCAYYLAFEDVNRFLNHLLKEGMVFNSDFPEISINKPERR